MFYADCTCYSRYLASKLTYEELKIKRTENKGTENKRNTRVLTKPQMQEKPGCFV